MIIISIIIIIIASLPCEFARKWRHRDEMWSRLSEHLGADRRWRAQGQNKCFFYSQRTNHECRGVARVVAREPGTIGDQGRSISNIAPWPMISMHFCLFTAQEKMMIIFFSSSAHTNRASTIEIIPSKAEANGGG